ncbi:MAG: hypothetical protein J6Y02_15280 [Pseudobutyrivibrio sp.]|nr:hypothetical protein [Pseudobutyrivibrio sp.]
MEQLTEFQFNECKKQFTELGEKALYLNHYQLAVETHIKDAIIWKIFLTDPRIADYISSEMNLIRNASINEIIHKAPNSKSVGQAQLINALVKIDEAAANKTGPVFIYSYVPLNEEQKYAPNIALMSYEQAKENETEEINLDGIEISTELPKK